VALVDKGALLGELGRPEEAAGAFDQVVERFDDVADPELRQLVAQALVDKGLAQALIYKGLL
jgi:hypothetical protein